MLKKKDVSKKELIKDLKRVQKQFKEQYPDSISNVTRNFYRKHGKYSDKAFESVFGNFTKFKEEILPEVTKYNREEFDIVKEGKGFGKYVLSSIVAGAPVDEKFVESLKYYCKKNKAELILLVMRGVNTKDSFTQEMVEKYKKYFATDFVFNDNLRAMDMMLLPQQILPLTGLKRFGSEEHSTIIASTKQFLEPVAQKLDKLPRLVYSTGTISLPSYAKNRQGRIAEQDNLLGALIVEVRNEKVFHIRNIQSDANGGFQDLDMYYLNGTHTHIPSESISIEPHYGVEDEVTIGAVKELIKLTNCKRIFFHDVIDNRSVNPHERKKNSKRSGRPEHQISLENELNHLGYKLEEWNKEFPNLDLYIVPSNHDNFIDRWLDEGDFLDSDVNEYLGCELRQAQLRKENVIEYYMSTRFPGLENLYFLDPIESYTLQGIELNMHGHSGKNGSKGSKGTLEEITGKCTVGHFHYPLIYRGLYVIGCACKLIQDYNSNNGGSSWLPACVIQHENGTRQLIIIINGLRGIDN